MKNKDKSAMIIKRRAISGNRDSMNSRTNYRTKMQNYKISRREIKTRISNL